MPLFRVLEGVQKMIEEFFQIHREEFIEDLTRLVAIDSSRDPEESGMPYGKGPAAVLNAALEIAENYGLYVENWDNYVGIVQLEKTAEEEPRRLDIFVHLDVVPGGSGWTKTEPFQMLLEEGRLYGRGTSDDKGPALAAIYSLRAIKEMGIQPEGTVRLVLGCDEESGSSDLEQYFARTSPAEMSFSPDADYPLINAEKGLYMVSLSSEVEAVRETGIVWMESGERSNVIPDRAHAVIKGMSAATVVEYLKEAAKGSGLGMQIYDSQRGVELTVCGKGGHASEPEEADNALTGMLQLLSCLPLEGDSAFDRLCKLNKIFPHGIHYGEGAGISMEDGVSGKLTASLNVLRFDGKTLYCVADCRVPVKPELLRFQVFEENARAKGFTVKSKRKDGHYVPEDSRLIKTLLASYEELSGEKGYCKSSGGSTYVHDIASGVAFGCTMPGVDNHMHGTDEFADLDVLLMSGKIFARAIFELCK